MILSYFLFVFGVCCHVVVWLCVCVCVFVFVCVCVCVGVCVCVCVCDSCVFFKTLLIVRNSPSTYLIPLTRNRP